MKASTFFLPSPEVETVAGSSCGKDDIVCGWLLLLHSGYTFYLVVKYINGQIRFELLCYDCNRSGKAGKPDDSHHIKDFFSAASILNLQLLIMVLLSRTSSYVTHHSVDRIIVSLLRRGYPYPV